MKGMSYERNISFIVRANRRRANARKVSFSISVRWLIYIINSVDKPNFRVSLPHRRSTTVSSETYPLYSFGTISVRLVFKSIFKNLPTELRKGTCG